MRSLGPHSSTSHRLVASLALLLMLALHGPASAHEPDEVAIADLTAHLSTARSPAHALMVRAELHRAAEQWDEAAADLADARALDPAAPLLDLCEAVLEFERGRASESTLAFERYLSRVPSDGKAHAWYARALLSLGEPAAAAARYDSALVHTEHPEPGLVLARVTLADSLHGPEVALTHLERALARIGASVPLDLAAVDLEVRLGRIPAALARLERVERAGADPSLLGLQRGAILQRAGRGLDACVAWSDALDALDQRAARRPLSLSQEHLRARLRVALDQQLSASAATSRGGTR